MVERSVAPSPGRTMIRLRRPARRHRQERRPGDEPRDAEKTARLQGEKKR